MVARQRLKPKSIHSPELPAPPRPQLLYNRRQVARLLGCSVYQVKKYEWAGLLKPLKPAGTKTGNVYFEHNDLMRFVERAKTNSG